MPDNVRFSQSHGIALLTVDGDWNAGFSTDSIDMARYNHCTLIIIGDTNLAGNAVITVMGGLTDAAETAAITFGYRYAGANVPGAGSDTYDAVLTSASLTTTATSMDLRATVIEFDASDLVVSGVQYRWATMVVSAAGTAGTASVLAILSEPRYEKAVMPSVTS